MSKLIKNITIGSDPEFFIVNSLEQTIPSIEYFSGTKDEPENIESGFMLHKDNVLVEGNIPPSKTKEDFIFNMLKIKELINTRLVPHDLIIKEADAAEFAPDMLTSPESREFGCSSYNNAWTGEVTGADDMSHTTIRTGGFHIHIGYELEDPSVSKEIIDILLARAYDLFVVLPSYIEHFDVKRSDNYGGLGKYRDKPYGVEVRSLGGYFAQDKYLAWVWDQTMKAIDYINEGDNYELLFNLTEPSIEDIYSNYETLNIDLSEQLFNSKIYADI